MRVRVKIKCQIGERLHQPGEEIDLPENIARRAIQLRTVSEIEAAKLSDPADENADDGDPGEIGSGGEGGSEGADGIPVAAATS
jgi:hypothetical protein